MIKSNYSFSLLIIIVLLIFSCQNNTNIEANTMKIIGNIEGLRKGDIFLQKVNIIRDFREDILDNEKIFWPGFLFEKYQVEPEKLLNKTNEEKSMAILDYMLDNACKHIEPVKAYLNAIPDEYAGFRAGAAVNFAMGVVVGTLFVEAMSVFAQY